MGKLARLSAATVFSVLVGLAVALPAQAADENHNSLYLATGDSVPFGYSPLLPKSPATNFVGYPDVVAKALGLDLTNSSCPGQGSGGYIKLSSVDDNGCNSGRAAGLPLHVSDSTSQLAFVVNFLKSHRQTGLVTITIGANDLFVLEDGCLTNTNFILCVQNGLKLLLATLGTNLDIIYKAIRSVYQRDLVAETYYALNYMDPVGVPIISAINAVIATETREFHGKVADGFGAFKKASASFGGNTCAAGLRILLPAPVNGDPCDVHPTPKGRDLLAGAVLKALGQEGDQHGADNNGNNN
jgi:lysophospholipase L1-like esterase